MKKPIRKKLALERSSEAYLLIDSSKIGKEDFTSICSLKKVTAVITDDASEKAHEELEEYTRVISGAENKVFQWKESLVRRANFIWLKRRNRTRPNAIPAACGRAFFHGSQFVPLVNKLPTEGRAQRCAFLL